MADDEEIICKGKSLCNYLADVGFGDFETFEVKSLNNERNFQDLNTILAKKNSETYNRPENSPFKILNHDYEKLITILNSELLFKEDTHQIDSVVQNVRIYRQNSNIALHTGVVVTGLLSSLILMKNKVNIFIPLGLTVLFSCYSAWKYYKEFNEAQKTKQLKSHVNALKKLSLSIFKVMRFIKETEILSTSQDSANCLGFVLYGSKVKSEAKDLNILPEWKYLPHLRKFLLDSLKEAINLLQLSSSSLKEILLKNNLIEENTGVLSKETSYLQQSVNTKEFISIDDLHTLINMFLVVQSDYLKEIALVLSPLIVKDPLDIEKCRKEVFIFCNDLQKKLLNLSHKMLMQYNIHRPTLPSELNNLSLKKSCNKSEDKELKELQTDVHNVFLLLYSALLRLKNLEDSLEECANISEIVSSHESLEGNITEQIVTLKEELSATIRCNEVLFQKIISMNKVDTCRTEVHSLDVEENTMDSVNIKETGIVVGTSDFEVNSPDEVFLSLSGANNNEHEISDNLDDWCLERKPKIPKTLLSELSNTLKSRKTDFMKREKAALDKKGLQDIDGSFLSNDNSEESDCSSHKAYGRRTLRPKYKSRAQSYSHSSDSDDEMDPFESGTILTKLKISSKYHPESYSDSDSASVNELQQTACDKEVGCDLNNVGKLANLAVVRSQLWGKSKEECYSDGSDS